MVEISFLLILLLVGSVFHGFLDTRNELVSATVPSRHTLRSHFPRRLRTSCSYGILSSHHFLSVFVIIVYLFFPSS